MGLFIIFNYLEATSSKEDKLLCLENCESSQLLDVLEVNTYIFD